MSFLFCSLRWWNVGCSCVTEGCLRGSNRPSAAPADHWANNGIDDDTFYTYYKRDNKPMEGVEKLDLCLVSVSYVKKESLFYDLFTDAHTNIAWFEND